MTTQTINQGTVDLVAQERGEAILLTTGLYPCEGRGHVPIKGRQILVAAIPRL
jgi:hypothetical protein